MYVSRSLHWLRVRDHVSCVICAVSHYPLALRGSYDSQLNSRVSIGRKCATQCIRKVLLTLRARARTLIKRIGHSTRDQIYASQILLCSSEEAYDCFARRKSKKRISPSFHHRAHHRIRPVLRDSKIIRVTETVLNPYGIVQH